MVEDLAAHLKDLKKSLRGAIFAGACDPIHLSQ
jgi:hypothetical protein